MPVAVLIGPAKPCRNELFCVPVRLVVPGLERFITAADPGDVPGADVVAAVVELNDILGEAGPDERSHDNGRAVTGHQTARRQVLRVEEFLPCPKERVWRALTDPDLIARWLMPNDFRLEAGRRFAIDSDPIRQGGLGGTRHCEVLAFDDGKMLRIAWTAAHQDMSGLDSAVTFTVAPEEPAPACSSSTTVCTRAPIPSPASRAGRAAAAPRPDASARYPPPLTSGALRSDASGRRFPATPLTERLRAAESSL